MANRLLRRVRELHGVRA
ncbi:hypothetical protein QJS66_04270 [Kocuria rhizophila]|nr:hypothetical protein QJS66_04270 [Kocuria rhizophila]